MASTSAYSSMLLPHLEQQKAVRDVESFPGAQFCAVVCAIALDGALSSDVPLQSFAAESYAGHFS